MGWGELKTQEKFQHLRGSVHAIMTGALFSLMKNIKQVMESNKVYGLVSPKDVIESIQISLQAEAEAYASGPSQCKTSSKCQYLEKILIVFFKPDFLVDLPFSTRIWL